MAYQPIEIPARSQKRCQP